jgi:hypothetical protein
MMQRDQNAAFGATTTQLMGVAHDRTARIVRLVKNALDDRQDFN